MKIQIQNMQNIIKQIYNNVQKDQLIDIKVGVVDDHSI